MKDKTGKIRSKSEQIVLSLVLGTVSIVACGYIVFSYYKSVTSHIERIAESAFIGTSGEVSNWVQSKKDTIDLLAKTLGSFNGTPDQIQSYLANVAKADTDFIDVFFGSSVPPGPGGFAVYATDWAIPPGYDWTTRPWFVQAVQKGGLTITRPYKDLQTGKTIISISEPVVVNGVLYGVISSDISTSTVKEIIDKVYTAQGSLIRLVDSDGQLINVDDKQVSAKGNLFDSSDMRPWKKQMLSGEFFMRTDSLRDRYFADIGLRDLGWIMLANGSLSSFEDVRATVIRFTVILLFLASLFLAMLVRSWQSNMQLSLATEMIERTNRDLEQTVNDRTASLRNILDSAEEGFLTFGSSLVIDPNYSRGCTDIFGKDIKGLSVPDVLFPGDTQIIMDFRQGFELYFEGKSKAQIIFDLTEKQTVIRGRTIRITYKETAGQRILCILTDVTLVLDVAEKNRIESETQRRILRAIHNKHFFAQFLETSDTLFEFLEMYAGQLPSAEEKANLLRGIHTFKGDAGFFGFVETQNKAHESETLIIDSTQLETDISYKEILIQIRKAYYKELKTITDTMGEQWLSESAGITIPRPEFQKILLYLQKKTPDDTKLLSFLDSFRRITLSELFTRLPFAAAVTAEKLGKKIKPMTIEGGSLKVVPDRFFPLVDACIHIVNNMVDHGIEYPYERESIQKPPEGKLELSISVEKSTMVLVFQDDGRGINTREIERIAKMRGLIPENRSMQSSELLELLFADGFHDEKRRNGDIGSRSRPFGRPRGSIEIGRVDRSQVQAWKGERRLRSRYR